MHWAVGTGLWMCAMAEMIPSSQNFKGSSRSPTPGAGPQGSEVLCKGSILLQGT